MDYFLSGEERAVKDLARRIAEEKVRPIAAKLDEEERFPWEIIKVLAGADLFRVFIPADYGGMNGSVFAECLVVEELSRACAGVAVCYAASGLGAMPILLFGSQEQKARYLPEIAAGRKLAAFALTEAEAGSDAGNVQTTAVKDGDTYVLNGTKQWITNGGEAEIYTVIARTDKEKGARGLSAFIVEKGARGLGFGKLEKKMGIRCSATREVVLQDCRVGAESMLGREGMGFVVALKTLDMARPGVGAQAVGLAQGALEAATDYAKRRVQFGQPIINFQAIQFMLADMATQIEGARALVYATARMIDGGAKEFSKESAMAKLFASDVAMRVTLDAVQIFGGYGYMRDYPIEKMMRDAKITQIYEGTNQIQRLVISRALMR